MTFEASKKTLRLGMLTNQELLVGFKNPTISGFDLNELKTEFHSRFKNQLYQMCDRLCLCNRFDQNLSQELSQDTMIKAFDHVADFEFDSSWPDEKLCNKIGGWLNKIATRLFIDFLRKRKKNRSKVIELDESYEDYLSEEDVPFEFEIDENANIPLLLQQAMDELDDRERLIIYLCIEHNCLENKNHLPDDVIQQLCLDLSIKKGHIRVLKHRALKKIRLKLS